MADLGGIFDMLLQPAADMLVKRFHVKNKTARRIFTIIGGIISLLVIGGLITLIIVNNTRN